MNQSVLGLYFEEFEVGSEIKHSLSKTIFESDNNFLNAAVKVETILEPMTRLDECQLIEKTMGRAKKSVNGVYKDRIIDIDILMYYKDGDISGDGIHINTPRLTIPHPLMNERDFVLIPLKQIL